MIGPRQDVGEGERRQGDLGHRGEANADPLHFVTHKRAPMHSLGALQLPGIRRIEEVVHPVGDVVFCPWI